ncbi:hypothetical protein K2Z83_09380 [Oscillochloris sp. ZM17-4]|uniref:hypothetical protein n=1 Tax=Oscillochloris sp. ZM17-4 TaxID=2866714 RepID=UPI001C738DCA|nr:hypothetical protein [Oscillochloris sp. ZM17-4]MBX0327884.1 hypothetical protein [Oscillochloris sp. ZM17-4]
MRDTLQPILDLLDDGLRLYRREFPRMALIAALGAVPAIIFVFLALRRPDLIGSPQGILLFYGAIFLALPLGLYLTGALSRATAASLDGRPVLVRDALAIGPLRLLGMGCYGGVFLVVVNMAISMISVFCFCPLYIVIGAAGVGMSSAFRGGGAAGAAMAGLLIAMMAVAVVLLYGLSLVLSGATYGSLLFSLQPFVQGGLRMGEALRRSIDITFYRFGANLLAYLCASLIFGTLALSATLAIGVLVPLPLLFLIGSESPLAQGLSAAALLAGLTLTIPPLPIWMAMLYRRRMAERDGADLAERIAAFAGSDSFGYAE